MLLIVLMYLLEVHFDDLYMRKDDVQKITGMSVGSIVSLKPSDSTWYDLNRWDTLDKMSIAAKWDSVSKMNVTIPRKLKSALVLNLEQVLFYLIPWFVLFVFPPHCLNKKKEYRRKYGSPRSKGS